MDWLPYCTAFCMTKRRDGLRQLDTCVGLLVILFTTPDPTSVRYFPFLLQSDLFCMLRLDSLLVWLADFGGAVRPTHIKSKPRRLETLVGNS